MSNGLHLNKKVTQMGDILQKYFNPEDLFEIFALDTLDNQFIQQNGHIIDVYMNYDNSINSKHFHTNNEVSKTNVVQMNRKKISYHNYYNIQGAA